MNQSCWHKAIYKTWLPVCHLVLCELSQFSSAPGHTYKDPQPLDEMPIRGALRARQFAKLLLRAKLALLTGEGNFMRGDNAAWILLCFWDQLLITPVSCQ